MNRLPLLFLWLIPTALNAAEIQVSNLTELAAAATQSGNRVTMKPGLYRLTDYIAPASIPERRRQKQWPLFVFSGSENTFLLKDVTIEVDTTLRQKLNPPVHTDEFLVTGTGNTIEGLTLRHLGTGTSPGGAALAIRGASNTVRQCTLHVTGSFPYGYGDLFGKGGPGVIPHRKKSGLLITGNGTHVDGCRLFMRSFGHGIYIQEDAASVLIENCTVEGEMRSTTAMLAETSGPAFDVGFRTVNPNREGEHKILPGYMKSLCEDGFRSYGSHKDLVVRNCTAKHMRGGFELRSQTGVRVENCTATGNERGFWITDDAHVVNCQGDASFGPLFFIEGRNAQVDLRLHPEVSAASVHAAGTIQGSGHKVRLTATQERQKAVPVMIGWATPPAGEGMGTIPERPAKQIEFINGTTMPVMLGSRSEKCTLISRGPHTDHGRGNTVKSP